MNVFRFKCLAAIVAVALTAPAAHAIEIDWVTVGDPGNAADIQMHGPVGSVAHDFRIMKFEWTNSQYVAFLNAVDPEGMNPNDIYNLNMTSDSRGGITADGTTNGSRYAAKPSMGDKPVNYVSWFDAARVANWLQAGGLTYGSTITGSTAINNGVYTLGGATGGAAPARNTGARFWIPLENEWYKAAYYRGSGTNAGYWAYATQSNSVPTAVASTINGAGTAAGVSPVVSGNFANYSGVAARPTTVGSNGGPSAYGAFDMSGNVWEWDDLDGGVGSARGRRGGNWFDDASELSGARRQLRQAGESSSLSGFRLASSVSSPSGVPEIDPAGMSSVLALVSGTLGLLERRRRARR